MRGTKKMYGGANRIPLEGTTFGRWYVDSYLGESRYLCKCECGTVRTVCGSHLAKGDTRSCGCQKIARNSAVKTPEPDREKYE